MGFLLRLLLPLLLLPPPIRPPPPLSPHPPPSPPPPPFSMSECQDCVCTGSTKQSDDFPCISNPQLCLAGKQLLALGNLLVLQ